MSATTSTGRGGPAMDQIPAPGQGTSTNVVTEWIRSWRMLVRWNAAASKMLLPLNVVVQVMMATGIVIGFGFLAPVQDPQVAMMLSTGAPTILLLVTGLVLVPQVVGSMKLEGSYDWFRSLPAPRSAFLFADIAVWTVVALPGIALAVLVAALRYDLDLAPTLWSPLAAVVVAGIAAMIGYAIATALPARIAQLLTQVLVFVILLFSPLTFSSEVLPNWLATVHRVLPMEAMADLIRAGLAPHVYSVEPAQVLLVAAWGVGATALTLGLMSRRA